MTTDHTPDPAMPPAVAAWFAALEQRTGDLAAIFTPDARVTDDGRTHHGIDEVTAWFTGPATGFDVTTTVLSVRVEPRRAVVSTRLEGTFPGGVVALCSTADLAPDGRIAVLEITPT